MASRKITGNAKRRQRLKAPGSVFPEGPSNLKSSPSIALAHPSDEIQHGRNEDGQRKGNADTRTSATEDNLSKKHHKSFLASVDEIEERLRTSIGRIIPEDLQMLLDLEKENLKTLIKEIGLGKVYEKHAILLRNLVRYNNLQSLAQPACKAIIGFKLDERDRFEVLDTPLEAIPAYSETEPKPMPDNIMNTYIRAAIATARGGDSFR